MAATAPPIMQRSGYDANTAMKQRDVDSLADRLTLLEANNSLAGEKLAALTADVTKRETLLESRLEQLAREFQETRRPNWTLIVAASSLFVILGAMGRFVISANTDPLLYRIATIEANQHAIGDDAKQALEATHISASADVQSRFDRAQLNERMERTEHQTNMIADDHGHTEDALRERIVKLEVERQDDRDGIAHAMAAGRFNPAP